MVDVDPSWNITDLVVRSATLQPDRITMRRKVDRVWRDVRAADFRDEAVAVAKGLIALGVEPGDRVAIMSRTRYEWTLLDTAIWFAGAITVPVYETSSPDQVAWILSDSGSTAIFCETAANLETVRTAGVESVTTSWVIDDDAVGSVVAAGAEVSDQDVEIRRRSASLDDIATIIYTSGTTGAPKGCELTHGNFVVLTENTTAALGDVVSREDASTLLFLPLAHVFARFIQVLCFSCMARLSHCSDASEVVAQLSEVQPTFVLSVPRVFEKIYNSAEQKAVTAGRGKLFRKATDTAIAYSQAQDASGPGIGLRVRHAVFDRLVYPKIRAVFGGHLAYAVSGGGPLGERLGHFYRGVGVQVLEGYGLTETTAPQSVNRPGLTKIGTVGSQLPGNGVRIAEDGEILLQGPNVFRAYHNNPQATQDAFTDGWFRTGDLGDLDDDGYLRITGRKKEILVTAGGKNVAPAVLEDRLRSHPLVSQCVVVGDRRPYIAALVTLDTEMLPAWAAAEGIKDLDVSAAATNPKVLAAIQSAVDEANKAVSRAESIRRFEVLDEDFTLESGHLTPSMKLKRSVVMSDYADAVDRLYDS